LGGGGGGGVGGEGCFDGRVSGDVLGARWWRVFEEGGGEGGTRGALAAAAAGGVLSSATPQPTSCVLMPAMAGCSL
jgi:hypothetical protein